MGAFSHCAQVLLPDYTDWEERVHFISHLPGIALGLAVFVYTLTHSTSFDTLLSGVLYGTSLILLYAVSCCYHSIPRRCMRAKQRMRIADHCSIFLLVAGSSTPFTLCVLRRENFQIGWSLTWFIWAMALLGIFLLAIDLERFKRFSLLLYLMMGLSVVAQGRLIESGIGREGFVLVMAGCIFYLVGLVLYCIKKPWTHAIFHLLCIIGSTFHCLCICSCIL